MTKFSCCLDFTVCGQGCSCFFCASCSSSSCRYFDAFTFSFVPRVPSLRVEVTAVVALLFLFVPVLTSLGSVPMPASLEEVLYTIVGPSRLLVPKPFFVGITVQFSIAKSRFISG